MSPEVDEADQTGQRCAGTCKDAVEFLECEAGEKGLVGTCLKNHVQPLRSFFHVAHLSLSLGVALRAVRLCVGHESPSSSSPMPNIVCVVKGWL